MASGRRRQNVARTVCTRAEYERRSSAEHQPVVPESQGRDRTRGEGEKERERKTPVAREPAGEACFVVCALRGRARSSVAHNTEHHRSRQRLASADTRITRACPAPAATEIGVVGSLIVRAYGIRQPAVRTGVARVRDKKGEKCVPAPCAKGRELLSFSDARARCTVHGCATRAVTEVRKPRGDGERRAIAIGDERIGNREDSRVENSPGNSRSHARRGSLDGGATSSKPGGPGGAMIRAWLVIYTGMAAEAS